MTFSKIKAYMIAFALAIPAISNARTFGSDTVVISIILPFSGESQSSLNNNIDFYSGALLAARKLGNEGTNVVVNALDYSGAYQANETQGSDVIIGPFKSQYVQNCLIRSDSLATVVSPLDRKTESATDFRVIHAATSDVCQWAAAMDWNSEFCFGENANVIIVTSQHDNASLKHAIKGVEMTGKSYSVCMADVSNAIEGWETAYKEGMENCVILATTNEAILNNVIRNLTIESMKNDLKVYANSKVQHYATIPIENLHKISAKVVCPYFIDYGDEETIEFIRCYRALFNGDPTQFSFYGYDLMYFLGRSISRYGDEWKEKICNEPQLDLLESSFKLRKNENGVLVNYGVRKVEYTPDFKVILQKNGVKLEVPSAPAPKETPHWQLPEDL